MGMDTNVHHDQCNRNGLGRVLQEASRLCAMGMGQMAACSGGDCNDRA